MKRGTDYLVAGDKVGATKLAKAEKLGVQVIDEAALDALIAGGGEASATAVDEPEAGGPGETLSLFDEELG